MMDVPNKVRVPGPGGRVTLRDVRYALGGASESQGSFR
jgi:hypothetical protein